MNAVAIVVGINDYRDQPLTSAVPDALAYRDALVGLGLVDPASVRLLTAPVQDGSTLATRDEITAALREPYRSGDDLDRLYVFFSGHGMLVQANASHTVSATAFLPADVTDPMNEPWKLLNLDDLVRGFRSAGPREQVFVFDACRNLRYDQYPPDLPPIGLGGRNQPPVGGRAQTALYAVSPGGQALGNVGGLGVMTSHLIRALHGDGEALDFDDELDSYVVTAQSVYAYVAARISEQVAGLAQWQREYMLPDQQNNGPPMAPLRLVADPGPGSLTLTVDPPGDAQYVLVSLRQRGARLEEPQWPPSPFGTPVEIPRQRFRLWAGSRHGATGIEPELFDARTMTTALIKHEYIGPLGPGPILPPGPVPTPPDPGLGPAAVTYDRPGPLVTRTGGTYLIRPNLGRPGWLKASTAEPFATVEAIGLDPPYESREALARSEEPADLALSPGSYRIRFRVGSEQFSETVTQIEPDRTSAVRASAFASPVVALVTGQAEHQPSVEFSEYYGPVQANPALTLATLIALSRTHDAQEMLQLPKPIPSLRAPNPDSWLSLAIAVDGSAWPRPAAAVAAGLQAEIATPRTYHPNPVQLSPMGQAPGFSQIVGGAALLPLPNSMLVISSAELGEIELSIAAARRMVTSIGIVLRADGGIDLAQLLTPPHLDAVAVSQFARRSLLGQWLYRSGELVSSAQVAAGDQLGAILTGEAVDPVLSPMAYHALSRELAAAGASRYLEQARERIRQRLLREFPEQVDAAVIAADSGLGPGIGLGSGWGVVRDLLAGGQMPVLADTLVLAATRLGGLSGHADDLARSVRPGSLWTLRWKQPNVGGA